jgi:hypothetical protein
MLGLSTMALTGSEIQLNSTVLDTVLREWNEANDDWRVGTIRSAIRQSFSIKTMAPIYFEMEIYLCRSSGIELFSGFCRACAIHLQAPP